MTLLVLPMPLGRLTAPRTDLVGLLGVDAQVDDDVDGFVELGAAGLFHFLEDGECRLDGDGCGGQSLAASL